MEQTNVTTNEIMEVTNTTATTKLSNTDKAVLVGTSVLATGGLFGLGYGLYKLFKKKKSKKVEENSSVEETTEE